MATLTKEQALKINEKCKAGFKLDLRYFMFHKEKQLKKVKELSENRAVEYTLGFSTRYVHFQPINTINITRAEWVKCDNSDMWTNSTGWDSRTLQDNLPKKMFNKVIEIENSLIGKDLDSLFDDERLLNKRVVDKNGVIQF